MEQRLGGPTNSPWNGDGGASRAATGLAESGSGARLGRGTVRGTAAGELSEGDWQGHAGWPFLLWLWPEFFMHLSD